ncbi:hypothetical protein KM043_001885 [Ampulex compressa]|nr:hypothetical protein KM043_001885 [Ampulex compressa]
MLEVNKYLASRLWYTSLTIHQTKFDSEEKNEKDKDVTDFFESEALIKNAFHSEDAAYCPRIVRILLQELSRNTSWNPNINLETFHDYVDINEALKLCDAVPASMYQELLTLLQAEGSCADETLDRLAMESYEFLRRKIYEDPGLACWIINELLYISCNSFQNVICALQDLYVSTLEETLNCTLQKNNSCSDSKIELFCAAKDVSWKGYLRLILCLLSKMKFEGIAIEVSTWLYPTLDRVMDIRVSNVLFNLNDEHTTLLCAIELLQRTTKRNIHWLMDILDICHTLTLNEKYQEVSSILSCQLLRNVWPILLFKILEDCTEAYIVFDKPLNDYKFIHNSIVFLIEKCNFLLWNETSIYKLNLILKNRLAILEHVLDWREISLEKSTLDENEMCKNREEVYSIKDIIFHLEHSTVLSSIKAMTNIHNQDYEKVQMLLKKIGQSDTAFTAYSSMLSALKAILFCETYSANYDERSVTLFEKQRSGCWSCIYGMEKADRIFPRDHFPILSDEKLDASEWLKDNTSFYCDDTALDEIRAKTDSGSESGFDYSVVKWQRHTRSFLPTIKMFPTKDDNQKQFFINCMLAPVESLVFQCLWRSNYEKAQQVIQIHVNYLVDTSMELQGTYKGSTTP